MLKSRDKEKGPPILRAPFSIQVSIWREVPQTEKDIVLNEPEDWILSNQEVKSRFFLASKS